jgi:ankyrin repeat protein
VRSILQLNPAKAKECDTDGVTSLHWACANGDLDIARLLLQLGTEVDVNKESRSENHVSGEEGKKGTEGERARGREVESERRSNSPVLTSTSRRPSTGLA